MSLFDSDKTGRKYPGYKKEELIFRLMMTLTEESPDLERKSLTEYIRTHTITEEEQERAFDAFKLYATITDAVLSTATPEDKKQKQKIYKRPPLAHPYAVRHALHGPGCRRPALHHSDAPLARNLLLRQEEGFNR